MIGRGERPAANVRRSEFSEAKSEVILVRFVKVTTAIRCTLLTLDTNHPDVFFYFMQPNS
jgi:hypothetical protein